MVQSAVTGSTPGTRFGRELPGKYLYGLPAKLTVMGGPTAGLRVGEVPSAEHRVQNAAVVHELAAFAERKFVSHHAHEAVPDVVIGAAFLQGADCRT